MPLASIFVQIILPVVLVIACGYVLERRLALDVQSVSRVALYAFSPCLIFSSLVKSALCGTDALTIWGFVLSVTLSTWLTTRALCMNQRQAAGFVEYHF